MPRQRYSNIGTFYGGLSDSPRTGIEGSFAEGVGVDVHSISGLVTAHQALAKDSGATVDERCDFAVRGTDGNQYWFSAESGKVWRRTSAGTWSLLFTNGNGACIGAEEFDDYVYYATDTDLGKYGPLSGEATNTDSAETLNTATYHPMAKQGLYLVIGNGRDLATVSDVGAFTSNGTPDVTFSSLKHNQEIICMKPFGIDVIFGTQSTDSSDNGQLLRWDLVSPTFLDNPPFIPATKVQAIMSNGLYAFVVVGEYGEIQYYDGEICVPVKQIYGDYSSTKYIQVRPGSTCEFSGRSLFGVSNGAGNPCNEGVYAIGHRDKNYPLALTCDYVPSSGNLTGVEIGAVLVDGRDLYVAWKDGTSQGVDAIDWSNKYSSAYLKTLAISGNRVKEKTFKNYVVNYKSKPTGTDLDLSYDSNYSGTNTSMTKTQSETNENKIRYHDNVTSGALQLRVDFTTSGNSSPEFESLYCDWTEADNI